MSLPPFMGGTYIFMLPDIGLAEARHHSLWSSQRDGWQRFGWQKGQRALSDQ